MFMMELKPEQDSIHEFSSDLSPISFHSSFYPVQEKLEKWVDRFPQSIDRSIMSDLYLLYLVATRKYLDHRNSTHLFRLILSIHLMQKKLLRKDTFFSNVRHIEIRWIPTTLRFPFSSRPVLSCLIGFNALDKYELFDEENIVLTLQKHFPGLRLVKESSYHHTSQHKNLKIFYFEIEKKDGSPFSLHEKSLLKNNIEEKIKNNIQKLSPALYIGNNEEEVFKNILVLSQEIQTLQDLPQACINLDQQTGKEIVFRVTLVYISPFHRFSLKEYFFNVSFVSQRLLTVRQLEDHPIEAHIFHLHLPRDTSLVRADGSLDFYSARQKVATLIKNAIGEFRDYNGGIIIKQQEIFQGFKERFPAIADSDTNIMETFFYGLSPLEKQAVVHQDILATLFNYFLENRKQKLPKDSAYSFKVYNNELHTFLVVKGNNSLTKNISAFLKEQAFRAHDITYNIVETPEEVFLNCVFLQQEAAQSFIEALRQSLNEWERKLKNRQVLRIASEYSLISMDPRIGGDENSGDILRLLFEGLTRYDRNGNIFNAVAESIEVSPDSRQYTFKLRMCLWNDGSPVSAYDFEYAWKKVLSPDFKTAFAHRFYPIKNAREAKEGKVSADKIGIHVLDDRTLKVELVHPTPYFLQLTAHPIYSPIHRLIDQQYPQWPYQCEKNYPCNGPFQLKINHPNQGYQFVKNPFYWDTQQIILDEISITLTNASQANQAFQKKELDWTGNPFGAWHSFYTPGKEDKIISLPNSFVCWCVFNTMYPPLRNRKLRQAFAYAIQRDQIVSNAYMPLNPAYSVIVPFGNKRPSSPFPDFDPDKARKLFHEGLQELNLSIQDISPISIVFHEKGIGEYVALCLQKQFKECLGITCEFEPLSWNKVFHKMTKSDFKMGLMHWTSRIEDPILTLNSFKFAHEETNFAKWEHPEYQKLLNLSEQEINLFQRSSYLHQAEEFLSKDMPIIPLFYQSSQTLVNKDIQVNYKTPGGPFDIARSYYQNKEI